ncbi:MAG: hypothetical protein V3R77_06030 [Candidatus Binatia bacterium]
MDREIDFDARAHDLPISFHTGSSSFGEITLPTTMPSAGTGNMDAGLLAGGTAAARVNTEWRHR